MVKNLPCNAGDVGSIPGQGAMIPCATGQLSPHLLKQKISHDSIAKFRLKLTNVEKTTRPFRYDINQIPYDYTVEMRNRFKGLDLIDQEPD